MNTTDIIKQLFYSKINKEDLIKLTSVALENLDDGELFLEYKNAELLNLEDGILNVATTATNTGFGLRGIMDTACIYAHSNEINLKELTYAKDIIANAKKNYQGSFNLTPKSFNKELLYPISNPLEDLPLNKKLATLKEVYEYTKSLDSNITKVTLSLHNSYQVVLILRNEHDLHFDIRPLTRFNAQVLVKKGDKEEAGYTGLGGRDILSSFFNTETGIDIVNKAYTEALLNLEARDTPAGEMPVVLGAGWPGVLIHEAVGHGLEGDFNRKGTSVFSDKLGKKVASKGVTIVDDGTIKNARGSISIDDEGTKSQYNTLIEDGILINYMQDRLNGRLTNTQSTGNGRRESYKYTPMPRMTNTYMLAGTNTLDEMIQSTENGIYAINFGGGQVDITSGQFVFSCTSAYKIEKGKLTYPLKGATIIGLGATALNEISMIGNDLKLDTGIGACGKNGQNLPVGIGQPSVKLNKINVGGTKF